MTLHTEKEFGYFYFKRNTHTGKIWGQYINRTIEYALGETAEPSLKSDGFAGNYKATWQNGPRDQEHAELKIETTDEKLFRLTWIQEEKRTYEGEGMIIGDMLVGSYKKED